MNVLLLQRELARSPLSAAPSIFACRLRSMGHQVEHLSLRTADLRSGFDLLPTDPDVLLLDGSYPTDAIASVINRLMSAVPMLFGSAGVHALENSTSLCLLLDPVETSVPVWFDAEPLQAARTTTPLVEDGAPSTDESGNQHDLRDATWFVPAEHAATFTEVPGVLFKYRDGQGPIVIEGGRGDRAPGSETAIWNPSPRELAPPTRRPGPGRELETMAVERIALVTAGRQANEPREASAAGNPLRLPFAPAGASAHEDDRPAHYTGHAWDLVRAARNGLTWGSEPLLDTHRSQWRAAQPATDEGAPSELAILEQLRVWHRLGTRHFRIEAANPWREVRDALLGAEDEILDGLHLEITSSLPSLRLEETTIRQVAREAARHSVHLRITRLFFPGFHDRVIRWLAPGTSHWDLRWTAGLLQALDREFAASGITATSGHRLVLFDPWTTLEELEETLAAVDEEAPFLRPAVSLDARLPLLHPYDDRSLVIDQAGLLRITPTGRMDFEIVEPRTRTFVEIAAAGLAPILEALGRFDTTAEEWTELQAQAIFSWFRELSNALRGDDDVRATWGRIVAKVIQHLQVDRRGPTSP